MMSIFHYMAQDSKYDYIIAGAGAAGLSLLWHLLNSPLKEKKILVVDSSFQIRADKTWCFWSECPSFSDIIYHTWDKLEVISGGEIFTKALNACSYHCIRSEDYQKKIFKKAREFDTVSFLETGIIEFIDKTDSGMALTNTGSYEAEWIFQSIVDPGTYPSPIVDNALIQHFTGWEIEVKKDLFDSDKATLMDFDTEQKKGLTFLYTLPYSSQKALVEYTIFSDTLLEKYQYESALREYLEKRFSLKNGEYLVTRTENGTIPMEDRRVPGFYNSRTLNIGTSGGVTKPTTGYTFTRAHLHSQQITGLLQKGNPPPPFTSSYRFRVYDIMLLYLLKNEPVNSRNIFHELFKKNDIETVLQFLDEKTSFPEELKIFSRLPYAPFFRSIYKMKHRIFTGA